MESAGSYEQDGVGANHAVASIDGSAFVEGQNVARPPFTGNLRAVTRLASGDFVDLVDEYDPHLLGALDSGARDLVHVEQLVLFFLNEVLEGIGHTHLALLFLLAEHAGKHVLDVDVHLLDALIGDNFKGRHGAFAHFDVDHALIELAFTELRAQFFTGALRLFALLRKLGLAGALRRRRGRRQEEVEDALLRGLLGAIRDFVEFFLAYHIDRSFHKVPHHGFHVAAHVATFGIFGGFDFHKWAARQASKTTRDFRLAY